MAKAPEPRAAARGARASRTAKDARSVAVVIPCRNAEAWIARAINSALDQNYPNLQVIVSDDGSTDGSIDIVESFGERVTLISGPNRGAPFARNAGLSLCTSEYVLFLDADDYISGAFIEGLVGAASEASANMTFGPQYTEAAGGALLPRKPEFSPADRREALRLWILNTVAQTSSILWRTSFVTEIGGWDESLVRNQDVELGLRGLIACRQIAMSDAGMSIWVQHDAPDRISGNISAEAANGVYGYLVRHTADLLSRLGEEGKAILALRYYDVAHWLFQAGDPIHGREALAGARSLGLRGHPGSMLHQLTCAILGLEERGRLARLKRRILAGAAGKRRG